MDLLETTLKVIENRNAAREDLTVFRENLKQYEDYINAMKVNLEETLLKNSLNKEILEMNNFTKNAFNENCKRVKDLFGIVYNYTQQIQERLSTIMDQETSLEETYNENEEGCVHLDIKYNNSLKVLVMLENDSVEKIGKDRSDMEHRLKEINEKFTALSESWKSIIDERDEKYQTSQATTLEVELLHDKLQARHEEEDLYVATIQENKEKSQKVFEEIAQDIEAMDNQLLEMEKDLSATLCTELKEHSKIKEEMLHNQNQTCMNFKKLSKDCSKTEMCITEIEKTSSTIIKKLVTEIESEQNLLAEKEKELLSCNAKEVEVSNANDLMRLKISASSAEFENMKIKFEAIHEAKEEISRNITKVGEENEHIANDYEELNNSMSKCKSDLCQKEGELQDLKSSPNTELLKIEEDITKLEYEYSSKQLDLQNDIQKNDVSNKQHQQTLEKLESTLKDLELQYKQLEAEKNNLQKVKTLVRQSEVRSNNIRRLEAEKTKKVKLIPTPPLQRFPPPQLPQKRPLLDAESDSSVDGERLSYAEFMARKRMLKESSKKTKRVSTKSK